jgi:heptosyltransferase-2
MSCGLAIVSTATGGNADILQDEFNALVIPPENPESCARQILRLAQEPELLESLGVRARQTIETNYRLEQSAVSLENFLSAAVGAARPAGARPSSVGPAAIVDLLPPPSLDKLVRQANSWLRWGSLIVLARNLFKPKTVLKALKKIYRDGSSFTSLLLFPAICRGFFYVTHRPRTLAKAKMPQPRQVLVVQLADLGDIILTSPFLRELRRFLPGTRIVLAVQPSMADLLKYCPYIDGLVAYDWRTVRNWQTAFKGNARWWWKSLWTMRRSFWKDRFDTAISLRWNNDPCQAASLILMYASGASRRVAYVDEANDFKLLSMRYVDKLITEGPVRGPLLHEVEYQRDILRFLGARPQDTGLEVWTSPEDERFAQDLLARHGLTADDRLVALAPGARWAFRRWPEGRFRELGRWLQEDHGASILIMAGKSERDLARRIAGGLQEKRTLNLAGKTTLRQMAAVLKRCQLFVGNDSGPLHVAAACGVPALGLFGTGEYERFRPWGPKQGVIRLGLTCNPCSENCHFAEARCIQGITVDQVKRALAEKLKVILK